MQLFNNKKAGSSARVLRGLAALLITHSFIQHSSRLLFQEMAPSYERARGHVSVPMTRKPREGCIRESSGL